MYPLPQKTLSRYGGRLEIIRIVDILGDTFAANGVMRDSKKIIVHRAYRYTNRDCLVRIQFEQKNLEFLVGYLISTEIPEGFDGANNDDYVLLGLIDRVPRQRIGPSGQLEQSLEIFKKVYDPGDLNILVCCEYFNEYQIIMPNGLGTKNPETRRGSISDAVNFLLESENSSRLILYKSKFTRSRIADILRVKRKTAVELQPYIG